jgi:membrane-bound inhibitor of C-type lysozyme
MTIVSVDDIAGGLSVAQRIAFFKNITVPKSVGAYQSSWLAVGNPGPGVASPAYTAGSGYTCDRTKQGALPYINAAVQNYLAKLFISSVIAGTLILYDRLWSCSGMGYAAGTYTVTTPGSLPARITDSGLGCEIWVEQFVAAGAASGTLTVNYLNTLGAAKAGVIPAVVSAPVIGQMQPVPMVAGDLGVSQIVSVVNSATWTSGSWGITILKRIAEIEAPLAGIGKTLDWASLGLPPILPDACLALIWQGGAATATQAIGRLSVIDK